jgi:prevent-host-death family protein
MPTITIEEARTKLAELIHGLTSGEEVVITENNQPVAKLVAPPQPPRTVPKLGTQRGSVLYMAPDFDAPLEEFVTLQPSEQLPKGAVNSGHPSTKLTTR